MLSAKGGGVMTGINCAMLALVAALAAACLAVLAMTVVQINRPADINDNREPDSVEADVLQRLKTAQFELRLISQEDPNAPDLRSVISRLQEAVITLQLKR
jgi:ribonuclease PH